MAASCSGEIVTREAPRFPTDLVRFLRWHWLHLVIAPLLGLTMITLLHELAHAAGVILQGGSLLELRFLPTATAFGFVRYTFPPNAAFSAEAISLAPYLMWVCLAHLALLVALLWSSIPFWAASTAFLWLFAVPMGDCAMASVGYLLGSRNDLYHALGPTSVDMALMIALTGAVAFLLGFGLQRLLYRERALRWGGYSMLVLAGFVVIGLIGVVRI